jgi:hypothetical protein
MTRAPILASLSDGLTAHATIGFGGLDYVAPAETAAGTIAGMEHPTSIGGEAPKAQLNTSDIESNLLP